MGCKIVGFRSGGFGSRWNQKFLPWFSLFFHISERNSSISCHFFPKFPTFIATKLPLFKTDFGELPPNCHRNCHNFLISFRPFTLQVSSGWAPCLPTAGSRTLSLSV